MGYRFRPVYRSLAGTVRPAGLFLLDGGEEAVFRCLRAARLRLWYLFFPAELLREEPEAFLVLREAAAGWPGVFPLVRNLELCRFLAAEGFRYFAALEVFGSLTVPPWGMWIPRFLAEEEETAASWSWLWGVRAVLAQEGPQDPPVGFGAVEWLFAGDAREASREGVCLT